MDLTWFCVDDGFAEAIMRGLRAGFLSEAQYNQMKNCASLPELKSFLEETDYQVNMESIIFKELPFSRKCKYPHHSTETKTQKENCGRI